MNDKIGKDDAIDFAGQQWELNTSEVYYRWRRKKRDFASREKGPGFVKIKDLSSSTAKELDLILTQCKDFGLAFYEVGNHPKGDDDVAAALRVFTDSFGLRIAESHRSAGDHGVVALRVSNSEAKRGYIPYSRKAMNWHTDGYYNAAEETIRSFVLHCARPAEQGGHNQFIDPEIAYMRLRDQDPQFVAALMQSDAMTIPPNTEPDGSIRPASIGPVFAIENSNLTMRYTARTRSIEWSKTAAPAVAALQKILETETEFLHQTTLEAGQGVLSNNALHNRTGFDPNAQRGDSQRLMYRIRFHNRIEGS